MTTAAKITPKMVRLPGWFRKGWTARPEQSDFVSKWGIVSMTPMGWGGVSFKDGQPTCRIWPKKTILSAMKEVEANSPD
jgi:hypothetical protein